MTTPRRRWFQFSLKALLVAVVVLSLPLSWFAARLHRARDQRKAIQALIRIEGCVAYDTDDAGFPARLTPSWLRALLGRDFFDQVIVVGLVGPQVTDSELRHLVRLRSLKSLLVIDTEVTDDGLEHLRGLTSVQDLSLFNTPITDAGLEHLKPLVNLRHLDLEHTKATVEGVRLLRQSLPHCEIAWSPTAELPSPPPLAPLHSEDEPEPPLPTR